MLNYQTTSFHDALYVRKVLGSKPAPEFETWLQSSGIFAPGDGVTLGDTLPKPFARALAHLQ
jgi:ethanolamine ammonia-lyase large subunit